MPGAGSHRTCGHSSSSDGIWPDSDVVPSSMSTFATTDSVFSLTFSFTTTPAMLIPLSLVGTHLGNNAAGIAVVCHFSLVLYFNIREHGPEPRHRDKSNAAFGNQKRDGHFVFIEGREDALRREGRDLLCLPRADERVEAVAHRLSLRDRISGGVFAIVGGGKNILRLDKKVNEGIKSHAWSVQLICGIPLAGARACSCCFFSSSSALMCSMKTRLTSAMPFPLACKNAGAMFRASLCTFLGLLWAIRMLELECDAGNQFLRSRGCFYLRSHRRPEPGTV